MGIKDIWYTEKGRIGIVVASTVLITSAIVIPTVILIDGSLHTKDKYIQSYGYDGTITSTGNRQNNWMGIDGETSVEQETRLVSNENYHPVDSVDKIIDGVTKTNGISYLSNTDVSTNDSFVALDISNTYDEQGNAIWINPEDEEYIHAPLNMTMKVPVKVSNILRNHLANDSKPTKLTIKDLNNADGYGDWLKENEYEKDFASAFILFNYVAFSKNAGNKLKEGKLLPVNDQIESGVESTEFGGWVETTFNEDDWGKLDGTEKLIVDGTATDEKALNMAITAFNEDEEANTNKLNIIQYLNNGGSFRAWETTAEDSLPPGVELNLDEYDKKQDGTANAFLGTASRGIIPHHKNESDEDGHLSQEISYWGYDEDSYFDLYGGDQNPDDVVYDLDNFINKEVKDLPLATTIATDSIVFFTTKDQKVLDPISGEYKTPIGITRNGLKSIFEYGEYWDNIAKTNDLEFQS